MLERGSRPLNKDPLAAIKKRLESVRERVEGDAHHNSLEGHLKEEIRLFQIKMKLFRM